MCSHDDLWLQACLTLRCAWSRLCSLLIFFFLSFFLPWSPFIAAWHHSRSDCTLGSWVAASHVPGICAPCILLCSQIQHPQPPLLGPAGPAGALVAFFLQSVPWDWYYYFFSFFLFFPPEDLVAWDFLSVLKWWAFFILQPTVMFLSLSEVAGNFERIHMDIIGIQSL